MSAARAISGEELQRCLDFVSEVYRENPYWVPGDRQFLAEQMAGRGHANPGSQVQSIWVENGGRIAACVTGVIDESYNRRWNERLGHLQYFEALPGCEGEVEQLFDAACEWFRSQGCRAARHGLLPGWQMPLTVDAYDQVPTIFHTYNPPYYHSYIKNSGFATERGAVEYQVRFTGELASRYREMIVQAEGSGVRLRPWDFGRLEAETGLFIRLAAETFADHWGFPPLTDTVMGGLTFGLREFLVPDFLLFAEADGEPAGFVYSLPDLNQAMHPMRGKDLQEASAELGRRLEAIDHGVLLIIGVRKPYRGRGVNLALAARSYLAMIDRGYRSASYTIVLDDNRPSRRTAEKLGARVVRNFVCYRKDLTL